MKVFTLFSITFILMACLFVGCGGDDDDDDMIGPDGAEGLYMGLTTMGAGSWAEYSDPSGSRYKMEYHGTDTHNGREAFVIEIEVDADGVSMISQMWIEKSTGESLLYVMQQGALLVKLDVSQTPDVAEGVSDTEGDSSDAEKIGVETYTTPTGKSVEATVYRDNDGDTWISSEVPFGMVQSISNGEVVSALHDFGLSGAYRDISKEDAENAEEFGFDLDGLLDL